jgi:transcriptional regulator GlxA family with amidase domain
MLTAKVGDEHTVEALGAGADDYISKPYHAETLRQKLSQLIDVRVSLREQYSHELVIRSTGAVIESDNELFVTRLIEIVDDRLGNTSFNVEELADEIGLSRRQLTRRVKSILGEAPSDLIHRMRLERAVELLEVGSGTVSEVAYRVGFKSASHFGAAFKEAFGHTPGEHIESNT